MMNKLAAFLFVFSGIAGRAFAQNNTSPYSMIGIGDLEKSTFDRTSGMGHAGVALSSSRFMYQGNPASFSKLDEHYFYIEVSSRFKAMSYAGAPVTDPSQSVSSDMQFKKLALATKVSRHWAMSFGLTPFSTSNYSFNAKKTVQGTGFAADAYYEGSGSTNQAYFTNSFEITKNLSVGLQASYLFGQLEEKETLSTEITDTALVTTRNIFLHSPYLAIGAQYKIHVNKQTDVSFGATVAGKTRLRADYDLSVAQGSASIIKDESYKSDYFTVPLTYTGGIAVQYKNAYTLAVDYHRQDWSTLQYKGIGYALVNSQRLSGGFEYSKKLHYLNRDVEQYFLQAGIFYNNSYLRISGQQLADAGATFGAGMQLARSGLGLQAAVEIGSRGTTDNGLIREKYTQVSITLSYRDFWISKKMKRYD